MFDLFGDFIAGSAEGGGLVDGLLNLVGRLFEGGAGEAFGAFAREGVAGEGILSRIFGMLEMGSNRYIDYLCWKDILGKGNGQSFRDFNKGWDGMACSSREQVEGLREVIKGHSFILQQLKAHENENGVREILDEYKTLGLNLPSEDLLKKAQRKLSSMLHPDTHPGIDGKLMTDLNNAKDAIGNQEKRALYERTLQENPRGIEKLFGELGKVDWKDVYQSTERKARGLLTGEGYTGARKWVNELSGNQKVALVFGTVATVAAGSYVVAKVIDNRRRRQAQEKLLHKLDDLAAFTHKVAEEANHRTTGAAAGIG